MNNIDQSSTCAYCGYPCYLEHCEVHHKFRRSTHPELIHDQRNHLLLCPTCHRRATDSKEFEKKLQIMFPLC